MRQSLCLFCLLHLFAVSLRAQQNETTPTATVDTLGVFGPKVWYFPIDRTELRRDYRDNARMFDALDGLLSMPDIVHRIDSIFIVAAASPIGGAARNQYLSEARARALQAYLRRNFPEVMSRVFSVKAIGVDEDGYAAIYEAEQERVAQMTPQQRQAWLMEEVYPRLQYVSIRMLLTDGRWIHAGQGSPLRALIRQKQTTYDTIRVSTYDTIRITVYDTVRTVPVRHVPADTLPVYNKEKKSPSYLLTVKTNLLYDLALLPNLAVEYSLTPRYSLAVEGYWSWWDSKAPDYWSYRIQAIGLETKYWLGNRLLRPRMTGHYLGIYVVMGNYDVRLFPRTLNDMGYLSTESRSMGITYGYVLPVGRRWDL
ncbi:MAG: DUF3575 domain-containing protein, partial [Prevotellaceae bacterium]|nr:DUF3575 domain-containing protein [Prevotellaceae bacterium]